MIIELNWMEQAEMNIDVRTNEVVYITINDEVIYIDDSTEELIIDTWKVDGEEVQTNGN